MRILPALEKFLMSMGIVCGFSWVVAWLFIDDDAVAALFGVAVGNFVPVVYTVLDELLDR